MKKIFAFIVFVFMMCFGWSVMAKENAIIIQPKDFEGQLGTFSIAGGEPNIGGYNGMVLRGATNSKIDETIPARVQFDVTEGGEYYIWCRSRDFASQPGVRRFKLGINNVTFETVFGKHGVDGWKWELAGKINLGKGLSALKVYDISAYFARLDLVYITNNPSFVPPDDEEELTRLISKYYLKEPDPSSKPSVDMTTKLENLTGEETIIMVRPRDFEKSLGTFNVVEENEDIGGYENTVLKGVMTRDSTGTIPAQVCIEIPRDGGYYIWCRSRDFSSDQGSRQFRLGINNIGFSTTYGNHGVDGWKWELAGKTSLKQGISTLKVYDTAGYYARLDMVIITDSFDFVPPDDDETITELLSRYHMKDTGAIPTPFSYVNYKANQVFKPDKLYMTIQAEDFENNLGTWYVATDNVHGISDKVLRGRNDKDVLKTVPAYLTIPIPKDGKYYIWANSRDEFAIQGEKVFGISIDETVLTDKLGAHGLNGWQWERVEAELNKGYHKLYVNDMTAFDPRMSYICITDDEEFVPLNKREGLVELAYRYGFEPMKYDVGEPSPLVVQANLLNAEVSDERPDSEVAVRFNGKYLLLDNQPKIYKNKPYILCDDLFGVFGIKVTYNDKSVTCHVTGTKLDIFENDNFAKRNKQKIEMESAPIVEDGKFYVPISIVRKFVDDDVKFKWDKHTKTLDIDWKEWH